MVSNKIQNGRHEHFKRVPWIWCHLYNILPTYKHTLCLLNSNPTTMAIKLCKVSITCFVMCVYKMYLTITSIFTLTSSLLWYITCSLFIIVFYQSQYFTENCFKPSSMLHPAAIFYTSIASTPFVTLNVFLHAWPVLLTSLRAATSNGLGHWLWPRWGSGCHWHQFSRIQSHLYSSYVPVLNGDVMHFRNIHVTCN